MTTLFESGKRKLVLAAVAVAFLLGSAVHLGWPGGKSDYRVVVGRVSAADEARRALITAHLASKYKRHEDAVRMYVDLAFEEAQKHPDVTPELILAVIQKESSLRPWVKSNYGAEGLMQVVRRWHPEKVQDEESLLEPDVNIRVGAQILQEYIRQKQGDLKAALVKYSGNAKGYANYVLAEATVLQKRF